MLVHELAHTCWGSEGPFFFFFTREAESEGVNNSPYVELSELEDKVQIMNWQAILLLCFEGSSSLFAS